MFEHMKESLRVMGDYSELQSIKNISGGDINDAYFVKSEKQEYFIKLNQGVSEDFFQIEQEGLERLSQVDNVNTPKPYGIWVDETTSIQSFVMEWIQGELLSNTVDQLANSVASLHSEKSSQYGYPTDTFIGEIRQENGLWDDWVEYLNQCRYQRQLDIAIEKGKMPKNRQQKLEALIENMDNYIPRKPDAVLLHGDLWSGNWLNGSDGQVYLIDPSVFYGDREFELAFTELFGGFPQRFYDVYRDYHPLSKGYEDKKGIYQLFYLLVHLNVFGEMYGKQVDRLLDRYVGKK
ncbi:fructosamine kinase family protein [Texcoconibacillus texcoconensis]|uniref:Fructosamine-3-kinase n=1 Tax=Texcoconibacillus texcoconensis TaxID=1095777 RepID=A0A840QQM5_9BACI|nr:fructosamine kinase family protein [Texcoconibacillus texcoconensis]MBB5173649.1 fructosamine-3-kinase [Texcoconibacillus texcoconensis]